MTLDIKKIITELEGVYHYIPRHTLARFTICFGVLFIVFILLIGPAQKRLSNLDAKMADLKEQIAEQNALYPMYITLKKKVDDKHEHMLPLPKIIPLPKNQISRIISSLKSEAQKAGMRDVSVLADTESATLKPDVKEMQVSLSMRGNFLLFRGFLVSLAAMPSMDHIETLQIGRGNDSLEYSLKLWLVLGT